MNCAMRAGMAISPRRCFSPRHAPICTLASPASAACRRSISREAKHWRRCRLKAGSPRRRSVISPPRLELHQPQPSMLVWLYIHLVDHFQIPEHCFDLVAIQIANKAAVIGLAIFCARAGSAFIAGASFQGCLVEIVHGGLVRCDKAEVAAIANACRFAVDRRLHPELRVFAAIGDSAGVGEYALAAEGGEHLIVEGGGLVELIGAYGDMRKDARVGVSHGSVLLEYRWRSLDFGLGAAQHK